MIDLKSLVISISLGSLGSSVTFAAGLELEGYEVVEKWDDAGVLRDKGIAFKFKTASFSGSSTPEPIAAEAKKYCGDRSVEFKAMPSGSDRSKSMVAAVCHEPDGEPMYGVVIAKPDFATCKKMGSVGKERIAKAAVDKDTTLNCLDGEGWFRTSTGSPKRSVRLYFGDGGQKTCELIAGEFRSLMKATPNIDGDFTADGMPTPSAADGIRTLMDLRLNCDKSKDEDGKKRIAGAVKSKSEEVQASKAKSEREAKTREAARAKIASGPNGGKIIDVCNDYADLEEQNTDLIAMGCDALDTPCNRERMQAREKIQKQWSRVESKFKREAKQDFAIKKCCDAVPERFWIAGNACQVKPASLQQFAH